MFVDVGCPAWSSKKFDVNTRLLALPVLPILPQSLHPHCPPSLQADVFGGLSETFLICFQSWTPPLNPSTTLQIPQTLSALPISFVRSPYVARSFTLQLSIHHGTYIIRRRILTYEAEPQSHIIYNGYCA